MSLGFAERIAARRWRVWRVMHGIRELAGIVEFTGAYFVAYPAFYDDDAPPCAEPMIHDAVQVPFGTLQDASSALI